MLQTIIKENSYQDSVVLMLLTSKLSQLPSVTRVSIMMGTPANKDIFIAGGFDTSELQSASSNDMVVMLEVTDEGQTDELMALIDEELNSQKAETGPVTEKINSWEKALKALPDANVALISLPGEYAVLEIERALDNQLHAFVFSDNVPLAEERRLKEKAHQKGLLVMGPDCGTGVIHGLPLAFTNKNRQGKIGVIGASGTGIQEVTTLIHRYGQGVTNAIGTGGRDLSTEVGAISMIDSIVALNADPDTEVIVVISKPPAAAIAAKVLDVLRKVTKPVVTLFLGSKPQAHEKDLYHAYTLEEAAQLATKLMTGEEVTYTPAASKDLKVTGTAKGIKGYYSGGTLAYEAAFLIADSLNLSEVSSPVGYTLKTGPHEVIDLGDDMYTQGKPHPMIDPEIRIAKIEAALNEPETAVIIFDVVLGYGAHDDMAGALSPAITKVLAEANAQNRQLEFIAIVVGTEEDPQGMGNQIQQLEEIGVTVCENNVQGIRTALASIGQTLEFNSKAIEPKQGSSLAALPIVSTSLKELISQRPKIINLGLQSFTKSVTDNGGTAIHFEWRPSAGGDIKLQKTLYFLNQYQFTTMNKEGN